MIGYDRTIRIWTNETHTELARLSHNSQIISVSWMDDDAGVVSLGEDGVVSKWTRIVSHSCISDIRMIVADCHV